MANNSKFAPRNFPQNFDHPRYYNQLSRAEFDALSKRQMEEHGGICLGHKKTVVHFAGAGAERRFIVEVITKVGSFYIESPCTYTPGMGLDALDGNLANDAEAWLLCQNLGLRSKRLETIFGVKDHIYYEDYIKIVSFPHAGGGFDDFEPDTARPAAIEKKEAQEAPIAPAAKQKPWWKFW